MTERRHAEFWDCEEKEKLTHTDADTAIYCAIENKWPRKGASHDYNAQSYASMGCLQLQGLAPMTVDGGWGECLLEWAEEDRDDSDPDPDEYAKDLCDSLLEELHQNYGASDCDIAQATSTQLLAARVLVDAVWHEKSTIEGKAICAEWFMKIFLEDYQVWNCEEVSCETINVLEWVIENQPDWITADEDNLESAIMLRDVLQEFGEMAGIDKECREVIIECYEPGIDPVHLKERMIGNAKLYVPVAQGWYRHYKGELYNVYGEALNTETRERMVLYYGLVDHYTKIRKGFARPKANFLETVERDGKTVPRFEKLPLSADGREIVAWGLEGDESSINFATEDEAIASYIGDKNYWQGMEACMDDGDDIDVLGYALVNAPQDQPLIGQYEPVVTKTVVLREWVKKNRPEWLEVE